MKRSSTDLPFHQNDLASNMGHVGRLRSLVEDIRHRYRLWRYPPRPMIGLWATLTTEQQERILARRNDV